MAGDPRFGQSNGKGMPVNIGAVNAVPRDRFGNPIVRGAKVLYRNPHDLVFDVVEVRPMLDPRAPTGAVQMILAVQFPVVCPGNQPLMEFLSLGQPAVVDPTETPEPKVILEQ